MANKCLKIGCANMAAEGDINCAECQDYKAGKFREAECMRPGCTNFTNIHADGYCDFHGPRAGRFREVEKTVTENAIDHPSHYTSGEAKCSGCGKSIECIDVTKHMGFSLGNSMKYIWRADHKGKRIEDLKKAIRYLEYEIEKCQ